MFSVFSFLVLGFQLFNPTITLNSGKQVSLVGTGPPVIFSSGLFNTMPRQLYNEFINNLKEKVTIVSINDFTPLTKNDIFDIADGLNVNTVSYISHSSFNPEVLESNRINKAMLIDPICLPKVNLDSFTQVDVDRVTIEPKFPVKIFKAEKLYDSLKSLPSWQDPNITGTVSISIIPNVGHPDLLDDVWAEIAKKIGFWDTAQGNIMEFKEWKYIKNNNIKDIRKQYRDLVSKECIDFIIGENKIIDTDINTISSFEEENPEDYQ